MTIKKTFTIFIGNTYNNNSRLTYSKVVSNDIEGPKPRSIDADNVMDDRMFYKEKIAGEPKEMLKTTTSTEVELTSILAPEKINQKKTINKTQGI